MPWQGETAGGLVQVEGVRDRRSTASADAPVAVRTCGTGGKVALITLRGEFDIESVPAIDAALRRRLGPFFFRRHLVFDLRETAFVDSTFVGYLVQLVECVRGEGFELVLARPRGQVRRTLLLVGFQNLTPIYDSLDGALNAVIADPTLIIPPALPKTPPAEA